MGKSRPSVAELRKIDVLVKRYEESQELVRLFLGQVRVAITESAELLPHVHSVRWRLKDPAHLRGKLIRKLEIAKAEGRSYGITPGNILARANDLAGIRILHLHTRQIEVIDTALRKIFREQQYKLIEGPFARTWDDESRGLFAALGIKTQDSPSLYTSVHYVIGSASRTKVTCEIQVRTLMEEVWGEVDHAINYPDPIGSVACREQIKVLARVTSSATRLVDSIFRSVEDHKRVKRARRGEHGRRIRGKIRNARKKSIRKGRKMKA